MVNAKPDTPESDRFKHQLFPLKEVENHIASHSIVGEQTDNIKEYKMVLCDQCGLMFEDPHDLQRHIHD